ncbi:MAG: hypothetical protein HYR56_02945, partial [Acidobacteria bacterium]|nr:hypothetical protein [Acidobacteriota bacterium]
NANAQALPANFIGCTTISITRGYEADVTPRPGGKNDGTIAITDWVLVGRFAAGLDTAAVGSEFQRADCAPRDSKGDGQLAIVDWVQAGRYAANLDAAQTVGGPTAPSGLRNADFGLRNASRSATRNQQQRVLRVADALLARGQTNTLNIELDAVGDENALGFSLNFDPNVLTFVSAAAGSGASDALLITNNTQTAAGRLGLALALPAGQRLRAGRQAIATVRFNAAANSGATTTIGFGDQPIRRQFSDANANALQATYTNGTLTLGNALASVSAASFLGEQLAAQSIVAAFGVNLAASVVTANQVPLPTTLAGTTVSVRDSFGVERLAPLFFVAPEQINYLLPPGTAPGEAAITVTNGAGARSLGNITIAAVAPGLFAANANGQGVAAAVALRIKANGAQSFETIARFDTATQRFVSTPIDLGPAGEQVFLLLFGTGLRGRSALTATTALIGGVNAEVSFAGAQGDLVGLDQVNVAVPRTLIGRGEVDIVLTVDGKATNVVRVNIK